MSSLSNASPMAKLRVGIFGTPVASGNRGVQALGESLVRLCQQASPGAEVFMFGSDRSGEPVTMWPDGQPVEVPLVHWRLSRKALGRNHLLWIVAMSALYWGLPIDWVRSWISRQTPWIRALEEMDFVGDVRGGDSFSDIYGLQCFLMSSLPIWTVIAVKGSIIQFPQTYGPYKTRTARFVARQLLLRSSCIIARDTRSRQVAMDLVGDAKEVKLSPDVAFALHVRPPASVVQCDPPLSDGFPKNAIGLNVNGLMFNGGYTGANMFGLKLDYRSFVVDLAKALLTEHPGELVLVPHTIAPKGDTESDNDASFQIRDALSPDFQQRVRIVTGDYDAHEIKSVIGRCNFFVGSRMHSCIGALSQGVPCVGVAYSMKFAGVFESVGMGGWVVDARELDAGAAIARVLELYHQRDAVRESLAVEAAAAAGILVEVFSNLLCQSFAEEGRITPTTAEKPRKGGMLQPKSG